MSAMSGVKDVAKGSLHSSLIALVGAIVVYLAITAYQKAK